MTEYGLKISRSEGKTILGPLGPGKAIVEKTDVKSNTITLTVTPSL